MTEFSKTISYVQEKYANQFTEYPILIFDKDELSYRYMKNNAFGESDEKGDERAVIIQQYVKEKTGVEITFSESIGYEPYTTVLKGSAVALPVLGRKFGNKDEYVMCAVFPASPNSNLRLETHRVLQLDTPGVYEDVNFEGLQEKFTYEEMKLFSLYHELGHCMDRNFMTETYTKYEATPHDVHLSESFAEIFGLLMLELEGYHDLAMKRAYYRNLYSTKMGKWFVDNPAKGFGNPLYMAGGSIYFLAPSLIEAKKRMASRQNKLEIHNLEDIRKGAKEIVEAAAYNSRSFTAVNSWFQNGEERALEVYGDNFLRSPEFFAEAYYDLTNFILLKDLLYSKLAGLKDVSSSPISSALPLDMKEFCQIRDDKENLFDLIEAEREKLLNWEGDYQEQLTRKNELDEIYESLSGC